MALTTFSGLKSSIADWLNRSDLTNQIADFIALTEADFNAKVKNTTDGTNRCYYNRL